MVSSDDNYAQHLGAMLTSLFENFGVDKRDSLRIIVMDGGINSSNKRKLNKVGKKYSSEFDYVTVTEKPYEKLYLREGFGTAAYYKISIPEIVEEDKVIYIDSDAIVLDDISELWEVDVSDYYLAACEDYVDYSYKTYNIEKGDYFNAGVMVINNKKWRRNNVPKKVRRWLTKYDRLTESHDQDAFNITFHKKWLKLHPKWNLCSKYFFQTNKVRKIRKDIDKVLAEPSIVHFSTWCGCSRPWLYWSKHPYKKEYYRYLRMTPWKGFTPVNKSKKTLIGYFRRRFIPKNTRRILDALAYQVGADNYERLLKHI